MIKCNLKNILTALFRCSNSVIEFVLFIFDTLVLVRIWTVKVMFTRDCCGALCSRVFVWCVSGEWEREFGDIATDPVGVLLVFLVAAGRRRQRSGTLHAGQSSATCRLLWGAGSSSMLWMSPSHEIDNASSLTWYCSFLSCWISRSSSSAKPLSTHYACLYAAPVCHFDCSEAGIEGSSINW